MNVFNFKRLRLSRQSLLIKLFYLSVDRWPILQNLLPEISVSNVEAIFSVGVRNVAHWPTKWTFLTKSVTQWATETVRTPPQRMEHSQVRNVWLNIIYINVHINKYSKFSFRNLCILRLYICEVKVSNDNIKRAEVYYDRRGGIKKKDHKIATKNKCLLWILTLNLSSLRAAHFL